MHKYLSRHKKEKKKSDTCMCHKYRIIKFPQENFHVSLSYESLLCLVSEESQREPWRAAAHPLNGMRKLFQTSDSSTCNANLINTQQRLLKLINYCLSGKRSSVPSGNQMSFQVKKPIRNFSFLHFTVHQEVMKTKNISFINNLLELPFPVTIS